MVDKIFRITLTVIALLILSYAQGQDYVESALLFSRTKPAGSARIQALGGAQTALGGDYSSALSNPAGLGMFNRSEFTISAGLSSHNTEASYLGAPSLMENRTVFNIPGFSYVFHMPKESGSFLGGAFAVSFSRTNDFNKSILYRGFNENSSIVDYFIDRANGNNTTQFDENAAEYNTPTGLAYFNYLIGARSILKPPGPDNQYFTDVGYAEQQEEILIKGASNQWSFSYGANISDKFFIGGGIGIASIKYKSQKIYSEFYTNPDTIQNMILTENLQIKGNGINATIGAIVRPIEFIQLGASFTTPTIHGLTETYDASMSTKWDNFDYYGDGKKILRDNTNDPIATDIITSEYNLTTPLRFSTGIAFISKFGFLSGEVEMTNPAKAKYSSEISGISYSNDNEDIRSIYTSVINYRVGAEYRYNIYRVRAGYGVQSKTYVDNIDIDNKITTLSGGFGIRTKEFYIDFALAHSQSKNFYQPYTFSDGSGPVARMINKSLNGMITLGFTF